MSVLTFFRSKKFKQKYIIKMCLNSCESEFKIIKTFLRTKVLADMIEKQGPDENTESPLLSLKSFFLYFSMQVNISSLPYKRKLIILKIHILAKFPIAWPTHLSG